jgi:hypothetical protein
LSPLELPTTSSTGQSESTDFSPDPTQRDVANAAVIQFGLRDAFGAQQESPVAGTALSSNKIVQLTAEPVPQTAPLPIGVAIAPTVDFNRAKTGPTLQTRQLWEGTVMEVQKQEFMALLRDKTNPDNPDETAVFPLTEVSEEDQTLVSVGAPFYWVVGSERTAGGQVKNVSMVQFRRIPVFTKKALDRALASAQVIRTALRGRNGDNGPARVR